MSKFKSQVIQNSLHDPFTIYECLKVLKMDSFYDQPRRAPLPTKVDQMAFNCSIPEVSILCQSKTDNSFEQFLPPASSYKNWRTEKTIGGSQNIMENKENFSCNYQTPIHNVTEGISRKHVRFESPLFMQSKAIIQENLHCNINSLQETLPLQQSKKKTFENIYMANIPNRHLDLSMMDSSSISFLNCTSTKKVETLNFKRLNEPTGNNNCDILGAKSSTITNNINGVEYDLENYKVFADNQLQMKRNAAFPSNSINDVHLNNKMDSCNQNKGNAHLISDICPSKFNIDNADLFDPILPAANTNFQCVDATFNTILTPNKCNNKNIEANPNQDPTVKDLLKIIQQQNEQIMLLQKQVAELIEPKDSSKGTCKKKDFQNGMFSISRERDIPTKKFAIDMTTSFEVSIRQQQSFTPKKRLFNDVYQPPKIQEIKEDSPTNKLPIDNKGHNTEETLVFNEPIPVQESCPSPVNSIHVDMHDYSSE